MNLRDRERWLNGPWALEKAARESARRADFDELMTSLDRPFRFWACPNGCEGIVEWSRTEDGQATCLECGEKRFIEGAE